MNCTETVADAVTGGEGEKGLSTKSVGCCNECGKTDTLRRPQDRVALIYQEVGVHVARS